MNRSLLFVALGLISFVGLRMPEAEAAGSANDCVRLRETQESAGLRLEVENNCTRSLACTVAWTVRCESATGRTTREEKEATRLVVDAASSSNALASARSCGDNWTIHGVTWDCGESRSRPGPQ